jgi:hypothetical protein
LHEEITMRTALPLPSNPFRIPSLPHLNLVQLLEGLAQVLRFALRAAFVAALILGVVGCGSSSSGSSSNTGAGGTTTGTSSTGAAQTVYVVQQPASATGSILEFSATASGSISPTATITPGLVLSQVCTDQAGDIYIATKQGINEYSASTTGTPTSASILRSIPTGSTTGIYGIDGMAVSLTGEIVIGQDGGDTDEWSATQTGNVAPERSIPGYSQIANSLSPVIVANQVAIDASDNLYIAPLGAPPLPPAVVIYGSTATGNVAPARTVEGTGVVSGVTVDSAGNIYTTGENCTVGTGTITSTCAGIISEYPANATVNTAPTRTISGSATQLGSLYGIKVDGAGNIFVVSVTTTSYFYAPIIPAVLKFSSTASGNVAPIVSFTSPSWTTPDSNPSIALH